MRKQIFFSVSVDRCSKQHTTIEVPVTVDTSEANYMNFAKHLASLKVRDAVRGDIKLRGSNPVWEDNADDPFLLKVTNITLIGDPEPPIETYSLVCSSLLAMVKSYPVDEPWESIPDTKQQKIGNYMRWLDHNIPNMSDDTLIRLRQVKKFLRHIEAPDELLRDLQ